MIIKYENIYFTLKIVNKIYLPKSIKRSADEVCDGLYVVSGRCVNGYHGPAILLKSDIFASSEYAISVLAHECLHMAIDLVGKRNEEKTCETMGKIIEACLIKLRRKLW